MPSIRQRKVEAMVNAERLLLFGGISGERLRTRGRAAIKSAAAGQQMGATR